MSPAVAHYRFNESPANILPSDRLGAIGDLELHPLFAGGTLAEVVAAGPTGRARQFDATTGLVGEDATPAANFTRVVSIVALLELDVAAQAAAGQDATICHYGDSPITYGLRIEVIDAAARLCLLRMFWQTEADADVEPDGFVFEAPPPGGAILVVASRFQEAGTTRVRYSVNGIASAHITSPAASPFDIGGNPGGGTLYVGYRGTGAGGDSHHLHGALDELLISDEEVSAEEAALQAEYFATLAPEAIAAVRALVPPGVYPRDPASDLQLELALEGAALGYARANAKRLQRYMLPDVAWGTVLAGWERRLRLQALPTDSIAERRTRILAHTATVLGFDLASIKDELDEVLGLAAAQVQILEFGNDYTEAFGTADDVHNNWLRIAGVGNLPAVSGGLLRCDIGAGAKDIRYAGIATEQPPHALHAVDGGDQGAWVYGKVTAYGAGTKAMAALMVGSRVLDQWLFLGVYDEGGTGKVGYITYKGGVLSDVVELDSGITVAPMFFRIRHKGGGDYVVEFHATDSGWGSDEFTLNDTGIEAVDWAGFALVAPSSQASVTGAMTADFDSFFVHAPFGLQRHDWYVYRDPGLGGVYDLEKADTVIQRMKPAHTRASAIDTQAGFDVETATSLTDRDLMGV